MGHKNHICNKEFFKTKDQAGVAAIEFALVLILLLMIVGAIIEFGRIFWYYDALTKATRDGARQMSLAKTIDAGDIQDTVVTAANNARVSPVLTSANVGVECLDADFTAVSCPADAGDPPPANVRVSIVGFNVTIGGWIPIFMPTDGTNDFGTVSLSPQTTMRYMF